MMGYMTQMKSLSETAKAVMGVVVGVVSAVVTRITTDSAALPSLEPFDTKGWALFVVVAAFGYFGVYVPANKQSQAQVEVALSRLPADQRVQVLNTWKDSR